MGGKSYPCYGGSFFLRTPMKECRRRKGEVSRAVFRSPALKRSAQFRGANVLLRSIWKAFEKSKNLSVYTFTTILSDGLIAVVQASCNRNLRKMFYGYPRYVQP